MRSFDPPTNDDGYFAEPVAARYDENAADRFGPAVLDPTVDLLAALAGSGRALELGIGTGRVAIPLAERGVDVHGSSSRPPWSRGSRRSRAARTSA